MSAETRAAVEEALRAHFTDETGWMLTDWCLHATGVGPAMDTNRYLADASKNSPLHSIAGLAVALADKLRDDMRADGPFDDGDDE